MMKNKSYNLVPYGVIEKAVTGDAAALLDVLKRQKAYFVNLSGRDADLRERLSSRLLEAFLRFRFDYQPPRKQQGQ